MVRCPRGSAIGRLGAMLIVTCVVVALAGCTTTPEAAPSAATDVGTGRFVPRAPPVAPTTEVPAAPSTTPPASCPAGSIPTPSGAPPQTVPLIGVGPTYCATPGSSFTLVLEKPQRPSVEKWANVRGAGSGVAVGGPVSSGGQVQITSTTVSGNSVHVVLRADAPGSGTITARYAIQACTPPTSTPCTAPLVGTVQADVVVITRSLPSS